MAISPYEKKHNATQKPQRACKPILKRSTFRLTGGKGCSLLPILRCTCVPSVKYDLHHCPWAMTKTNTRTHRHHTRSLKNLFSQEPLQAFCCTCQDRQSFEPDRCYRCTSHSHCRLSFALGVAGLGCYKIPLKFQLHKFIPANECTLQQLDSGRKGSSCVWLCSCVPWQMIAHLGKFCTFIYLYLLIGNTNLTFIKYQNRGLTENCHEKL